MSVILRPDPALGTARNIFPRKPDCTMVMYTSLTMMTGELRWNYKTDNVYAVGDALDQIRKSEYLKPRCLVRVYLK